MHILENLLRRELDGGGVAEPTDLEIIKAFMAEAAKRSGAIEDPDIYSERRALREMTIYEREPCVDD